MMTERNQAMKKSKIEWTDYTPKENRAKVVTNQGYVLVYCPEHPNANKGRKGGYIFEHRLVMSNQLKRPLMRNEHVHHVNGDKSDNRIVNLMLFTNSDHLKFHGANLTESEKKRKAIGLNRYAASIKKQRRMIPCACGCGILIKSPDIRGRERRFVHGHNARNHHWTWGGTYE
jgi:hypothetical protein